MCVVRDGMLIVTGLQQGAELGVGMVYQRRILGGGGSCDSIRGVM